MCQDPKEYVQIERKLFLKLVYQAMDENKTVGQIIAEHFDKEQEKEK